MSTRSTFQRELESLRAELAQLTIRFDRLAERALEADFEVVESTSSAVSEGSAPLAPQRGQHTDREREEAAKDTGRFFKRCLEGKPRGDSGRGRIRLQNRIYVVVRTYQLEVHTSPVIVLDKFSQVKKLVCHPEADAFGDSVFAGFPSQWEARLDHLDGH